MFAISSLCMLKRGNGSCEGQLLATGLISTTQESRNSVFLKLLHQRIDGKVRSVMPLIIALQSGEVIGGMLLSSGI